MKYETSIVDTYYLIKELDLTCTPKIKTINKDHIVYEDINLTKLIYMDNLSYNQRYQIAYQLINIINQLHHYNLTLNNLSIENIYLDEKYQVKILDYSNLIINQDINTKVINYDYSSLYQVLYLLNLNTKLDLLLKDYLINPQYYYLDNLILLFSSNTIPTKPKSKNKLRAYLMNRGYNTPKYKITDLISILLILSYPFYAYNNSNDFASFITLIIIAIITYGNIIDIIVQIVVRKKHPYFTKDLGKRLLFILDGIIIGTSINLIYKIITLLA